MADGLKAGDPVGELPDPMATIASRVPAQVVHTSGGGAAIYRPGQPTTIFGGSGLHPFSKELLGNGTFMISRKAALTREGVDEENWMYEAARRTREADQRFKELRWKAMGIVKNGNIVGNVYDWMKEGEEPVPAVPEGAPPMETDKPEPNDLAVGPTPEQKPKKRKRMLDPEQILGVYEAHTGLIQC
jgi:chromatin structure-remodeling complex protein RSC7